MNFARSVPSDTLLAMLRMPSWGASGRIDTLEDAAFFSGAALSHLHLMLAQDIVPHAVLRERMALRAAEVCVALSGRPERAGELRDAVHLRRLGDLPGPAGEVCLAWRRAVERPISLRALQRALPDLAEDAIARGLDVGPGPPVTRAAAVLDRALTQAPRAEASALILADAALGQALNWDHLVPLLTPGLTRADLRKRDADLRLACHRAVARSAAEAGCLAADLARRAAHLKAVAPKLRAKQAGAAVDMFLTRDAVAPAALPLPDRAARRLCDRLVYLGAIRELTGRDSFRLYGL